jgi:hypothetical protein
MTDGPETTTRTERLLDAGTLLIALGSLALAVSLFLDWYGVGFNQSISAWTAFEFVDILLAALALAALVAVGERMIGIAPVMPPWVHLVCGPIALVIVCVSLIDEPPAAGGPGATLEIGGWIAFAAAAVMTIGALLTRVRISVVVGARERTAASPSTSTDPDAETRRYPTE